jgi:hypothetical protein
MIRRFGSIVAGVVLAIGMTSATALAGQPNVSCDDFQPGPPGFNSGGFTGTAEHVYANPGSTGGTKSGNSHVVSQYDVACEHFSQHH